MDLPLSGRTRFERHRAVREAPDNDLRVAQRDRAGATSSPSYVRRTLDEEATTTDGHERLAQTNDPQELRGRR